MQKFTTNRGTDLYYEIVYQLGGYNQFTSQQIQRGYYLNVQRNPQEVAAFSNLTNEAGSIDKLIRTTSRKSQKTLDKLNANAETYLKDFLEKYYPTL